MTQTKTKVPQQPIDKANMQMLYDKLKEMHSLDKLEFDMNCMVYIGGDINKKTRADLIEFMTGQRFPNSKCGFSATVNALKTQFEQFNLFE